MQFGDGKKISGEAGGAEIEGQLGGLIWAALELSTPFFQSSFQRNSASVVAWLPLCCPKAAASMWIQYCFNDEYIMSSFFRLFNVVRLAAPGETCGV